MITYCCFYIYSYIGQLIEKRKYERKVAKKVLQNYQVDLYDRATNVKKRILSDIGYACKGNATLSIEKKQVKDFALR